MEILFPILPTYSGTLDEFNRENGYLRILATTRDQKQLDVLLRKHSAAMNSNKVLGRFFPNDGRRCVFFRNRNPIVEPGGMVSTTSSVIRGGTLVPPGSVGGFVESYTTYNSNGSTSSSAGVYASTEYVNTNSRSSINSRPIRDSRGLLPMRAYSRIVDRVTSGEIRVEPKSQSLPRTVLSTTGYRLKGSPPIPSSISARAIAVNRALARLKDTSVNLGAAIGEGGQTLSLLLTAVRRIATARKYVAKSWDVYKQAKNKETILLNRTESGRREQLVRWRDEASKDQFSWNSEKAARKQANLDRLNERIARYDDSVTRLRASHQRSMESFRRNLLKAAKSLVSQGRAINYTQISVSKPTSISGLWLELQYGWLPLIQDVHDLVSHFEKSERVGLIRVSGSSSEQRDTLNRKDTTGLYSLPATSMGESSTYCRCVLFVELSNKWLQQGAQLGLTNPATVLWELTPYSFLVDWFLPIGKFLDNLDAGLGYTFISGCVSTRVSSHSTTTISSSSTHSVSGCTSVSREYTSKSREVLTGIPTPGFPVFKNPVSTKHFLNALALLAQHSRRP